MASPKVILEVNVRTPEDPSLQTTQKFRERITTILSLVLPHAIPNVRINILFDGESEEIRGHQEEYKESEDTILKEAWPFPDEGEMTLQELLALKEFWIKERIEIEEILERSI
ncbi:MAG: hypothetical protein Q7S10_00430 [bacterium]|nr:hypothetical protein [bacterium]